LAAVLAPWMAARTLTEVTICFRDADVCFGPYQSVRELLDQDPEASLANPLFTLQNQPGIGAYLMPGSPLAFSAHPRLTARPAPRLGEHTDEILADILGLPTAEIGRLHAAGVVAGPN